MEKFYLVLEGKYNGNFITFWAKGGGGYTSNFGKAEEFSLGEAQSICKSNPNKFTIWKGSHLDDKWISVIDSQHINRKEGVVEND